MENVNQGAPVIPAGTTQYGGGVAYDPLTASVIASSGGVKGQTPNTPVAGKSEVQIPQPVQTEVPKGVSFEELAAKKGFKTPDDLAKAYSNLESHNTRVEMSFAELAKIREDQLTAAATGEVVNANVTTPEEAVKVVDSLISKRVRPLEDKLALQDVFMKNADAAQYAAQMAQVVKTNPNVSWEHAYKLAKFDDLETKAREAGKQEAYQNIQQKQAVSVGSQPRASVKDEKPLTDLIADRSVPFQEIQRVMRERFRL